MRLSDQIFLNGIKGEALAFVNEAEWQLVEKAVSDAGSVLNTQGMARTIIEKASFGGNRSEAGRYAANMRWKGQGNSNNSPSDPSDKMATRLRSIAEGDLSDIASIIRRDFAEQGKKIPPAAQPYLDALSTLGTVDDAYGMDSGKSIVAYTLSNLTSYKGETARAVKAELKARLKGKKQSETNEDPKAPSEADMAGMTERQYQREELNSFLEETKGNLQVETDLNGSNTEMARNLQQSINNTSAEIANLNYHISSEDFNARSERFIEEQRFQGNESPEARVIAEIRETPRRLRTPEEKRMLEYQDGPESPEARVIGGTNDSPEFTGRSTGRQGGALVGPKWKSGQSLKDIASGVRQDVKAVKLPAGVKLGVRMRDGLAIQVDIKGFKGDQQGPEAKALRAQLESIRRAYNRSDTDSMVDYFDETYYGSTEFRD